MYNLIVWQEWDFFVWKVLENSVSSFWASRDEAYRNTLEALELYNEGQFHKLPETPISSPELYSLETVHA